VILTIDPGVRGCGCAAWTASGELLRAAYVPAGAPSDKTVGALVRRTAWAVESWISDGPPLEGLVIERPQTYHGRAARGDTNDLLDLSLVVGALSLLSTCPLILMRPSEWKGNAPKGVTEARARKQLGELVVRVDLSCGKRLSTNIWDAVGIGLRHFRC
jgi:hypothetical protein